MKMTPSRCFKITFLSWIVIVSVVLFENRRLFLTPLYEQADDAANSLSIERAKHGTEIYGNYSRFDFRHPGPAFVYVYAAGEAVLEDLLGLVKPRHNAHLVTGILLQAAFLALAIGIAASMTGKPVRASVLITAVALIHFAFVPGSFAQIWPPLVLMMPFVLLMVAAASVSMGRTEDVAWLALASAFLVHGHIAQLLFVAVILAVVLGVLLFRRLKGERIVLPSRGRLWAVAVIAAVTVLPWAIDASRGRDSNIFDIWLHVKHSTNDPLRPGWRTAVEDTASYFCYGTGQDEWFSPGASLDAGQFLSTNAAGMLVAWAGLLGCGYVLWSRRRELSALAVFQRHLACLCGIATLLAVYWATRQDGGITFFNSLFVFGLVMAVWIIPVLSVAEGASKRTFTATAVVLAGIVASTVNRYGRLPEYMVLETVGKEAAVIVPKNLATEAHPERPKLLVFAHDEWDQAVTVAAALNRMGIRSYVPESGYGIWKRMFGEDHVLESLDQAKALGPFTWWRPTRGAAGYMRLSEDLEDDMSEIKASRFPFSYDLAHPVESFGLSAPEGDTVWTESRVVLIRLKSEPATSDVQLTFRASGLPLDRGLLQRVRVSVNGTELPTVQVTDLADHSVTVPPQAWNGGPTPGEVDIALGLPDAARLTAQPHSTSTDGRLLGICLHELRFKLEESKAAEAGR
jgi:hypothetical protein